MLRFRMLDFVVRSSDVLVGRVRSSARDWACMLLSWYNLIGSWRERNLKL